MLLILKSPVDSNGIWSVGITNTPTTGSITTFVQTDLKSKAFTYTLKYKDKKYLVTSAIPNNFSSGDTFWEIAREQSGSNDYAAFNLRITNTNTSLKVEVLEVKYGGASSIDFDNNGTPYFLSIKDGNEKGYGMVDFNINGSYKIPGYLCANNSAPNNNAIASLPCSSEAYYGYSVTAINTNSIGNKSIKTGIVEIDTFAPSTPVLTIKSGEDNYLRPSESSVTLSVAYHAKNIGDIIQLQLGGNNIQSYIVTDINKNSTVEINILKASLTATTASLTATINTITAIVTDRAGEHQS